MKTIQLRVQIEHFTESQTTGTWMRYLGERILIIDGHGSHVNLTSSILLEKIKSSFIAFQPHTTHGHSPLKTYFSKITDKIQVLHLKITRNVWFLKPNFPLSSNWHTRKHLAILVSFPHFHLVEYICLHLKTWILFITPILEPEKKEKNTRIVTTEEWLRLMSIARN